MSNESGRKSETIGKLAEALAKAQGEMSFAKKDSVNPFFKSKYADLASVIEAVREPFSKNGLSYSQFVEDDYLCTMLMHSSNEWILGKIKILNPKGDMQGLGSAMTYARRYGLSAIAGVSQDDDDGNGVRREPETDSKVIVGDEPRLSNGGPIRPVTEASNILRRKEQGQKIAKLRTELNMSQDEVKSLMKSSFQVEEINFLTLDQLKELTIRLENLKAARDGIEQEEIDFEQME